MAIDYGRQGIRVNALCPGFIDTPMMQAVVGMAGMEDFEARMIDEHTLRRKGRAEEMATAAVLPAVARRELRDRSHAGGRRRVHGRPGPRHHHDDGACT